MAERPGIRWGEDGLVPVIIQDAHSGLVLTLAYANEEALKRTEETGQTHLWSRSRQELWHKGATSGNTQEVVEIRVDCDEDALLYRIIPAGPACHTGEETCFYRTMANGDASPDDRPVLERLEGIIADRKISPQEGSYTTSLFSAGENEIVKKLGEEAVEVVVAAKGESQDRIIYEVADLVYHTFVLLAERGLAWSDVEAELARRYRE